MMYCSKKKKSTMNKLLLAGDTFISEMHLKQPRFTYNVVVYLQKAKKESKFLFFMPVTHLTCLKSS